tara:strand:- start:389 stop:778 length:390 start_codon:yes stop_codon:yes gene_type:complete
MGYMDISMGGSDFAAGLASNAFDALAKVFRKHMKEEDGNAYNTSGVVNVALWFEGCVSEALEGWCELCENPLYNVAVECRDRLIEEEIKPAQKKSLWENEDNRIYHLTRYRELRNALNKFIRAYERQWD